MIYVNGSGVEKRSAIRGLYFRDDLFGRAVVLPLSPSEVSRTEAPVLVEVPARAEVLARVEGPVQIVVLARV